MRQSLIVALWLTFDNGKLKFAKYAYDYVTDPGNYFMERKTFTYSSSVHGLENYIISH